MSQKLNYLLLVPILITIYFSYLAFASSKSQKAISKDLKLKNKSFSYSQLDSMLNGFPNINASALPVDIWRVQYLLHEGKYNLAKKYVKSAADVNPHVYVSEYLQGLIFLGEGNLDSAYYYSKKAFEGWPKNIEHYNSYVDVLEFKKDTISLIKAFDTLDVSLKNKPAYFKRFYSSFNKIKLSYLITSFEDERDLSYDDAVGNVFDRGYVFPNNQVIRDSTSFYTFKSNKIISNQNGDEFLYKLDNDTLLFYYKRDPIKPVVKYATKFSPARNTIIFRNVEFEKDKFQDQFFIKSN